MNLNYVTEGKGKSAKEILKRIDYGGSATLMMAVGSCILFLSAKYNEGLPWSDPFVTTSAILSVVFAIAFVIVELCVAPEPMLAPSLLKQSIPVLVGTSNFMVATCNFSIMYFYPMWFQTVMLTSASVAVALLVHLPDDQMAVGTGFGQLFRGVGQVGGVAISSAVFQSKLEDELRKRIVGFPDAEALIKKIRQNSRVVGTLPPDLRRAAQESYKVSLKSVFFFAACMTLLAYIVRLPIPDKHLDAGHPKHDHHKHHHRDQESQEPSDGGETIVGVAPETGDGNDPILKKSRNASTTGTDYGTLTTTTSKMTVASQQSTLRGSNVFKEAALNTKSECNSESGKSESDSEFDEDGDDGPGVEGRPRMRTRRMSTYEPTEGALDPQASYSKPTI
ncbi:hypothetical protein EST38_g6293 [Candolleomyces aberdarensis]|uniref:Uncharacterized protein n=1 Tax=Candolleomyces aberdarensis TaxID=2316362 RepID=A0A4Q2DK98_9AGAR|nr:hypothetical protein EST38_g6293 [Candolleomyces aberdarensis]